MASTLVDLEHAPYRNEGFCAALELAVAAARELGPVAGARDAGLDERVQREAILRLRSGATANPGLLPLLAEGRFADLGAGIPGADEVSRALAVPDLFCLVAPPGTERTLTVLEIVRAATERGERVLLVAPVAPRVDAILARLPGTATVVRLDQDGGADHAGPAHAGSTHAGPAHTGSVHAGPGSLAAAAAGVQQRILTRSQAAAHALEPWLGEPSPAMGWLRRLTTALAEAAEARQRADRAAAHRDATVRAARARLGAPLRERALAREAAARAVAEASALVDTLTTALRRAETSRLRRWQINGLRLRLGEAVRLAATARAAHHQAHAAYEEGARLLTQEADQDATVRAAADRAAFAEVAAERALESAERSAHHLTRLLAGVAEVPGWTADADSLAGLAGYCQEREPVLRGRAGLLREWRHRAARPTRQLHTELLRYADVVATTCLGAGRPEHGDLEFDLLVLDDACRVPVPAALVPLVRARRAVLVGENRRLPLRDTEMVRAWMAARCPAGADADELSGLLTGSVFERVAALAPAGNRAVTGW